MSESVQETARSSAYDRFFAQTQADRERELSLLSTRSRASTGLAPHETELAGYLMASAAMNESIDNFSQVIRRDDGTVKSMADVLSNLRLANESLQETRSALPHGRGNVDQDIERTGGESSRREQAGKFLRDFYSSTRNLDTSSLQSRLQLEAATRRYTGEATCGGSATVAMHSHASRLKDGQTVSHVRHVQIDHEWAEVRSGNGRSDNDPIIDRWCDGPAVLRTHSEFASRVAIPLNSLDAGSGKVASEAVASLQADMQNSDDVKRMFDLQMRRLSRTGYQWSGQRWEAESVLSGEFRQRTASLLVGTDNQPAHLSALEKEILAVGVARSLGSSIREASASAQSIESAAARLSGM